MNTALRKVIATFAFVAVVAGSFTPAAFAAYTDLSAAQKLADAGHIVNHADNPSAYNLSRNVFRQEAVAVASSVAGVDLDSVHTCQGYYSDVSATTPNTWVCRTAERAADANIITRANDRFRPEDNVTVAEAFAMVSKSSCLNPNPTGDADWTARVAENAEAWGVVPSAASFNANAAATRGQVFRFAAELMDYADSHPGGLDNTLPGCEDAGLECLLSILEDEVAIASVDEVGVVSGTAEPNSEVTVTVTDGNGDSAEAMGTANAEGSFTVDVDVSGLMAGPATFTVDATSPCGEMSSDSAGVDVDPDSDDAPVVIPTGGDLTVSLSPDTPAGVTIPRGADGIQIAIFDFTAGDDDVVVNGVTLTREGISQDADTDGFALITDTRLTDSKDENSDDEVVLTISQGGLLIPAGQTVPVGVLLDSAAAANANAEIAVAVTEVVSNASGVSGLPVQGETFEIGSANAPQLEVTQDGSVSDPQLGEVDAELFQFELANNSTDDDLTVWSITFEQTGGINDDELSGFKLWHKNEVISEMDYMVDDFLTFAIPQGLEITEGNNEDLEVTGTPTGGAGETIVFTVDEPLDILASSEDFGPGVDVLLTGPLPFPTITVEAGELTLIELAPPFDEIRDDKDDVVLAAFEVHNNAGNDLLELQEVGFTVNVANGGAGDSPLTGCAAGSTDAACYLEDVQLHVVESGARYDLDDVFGAAPNIVFGDNSIDLLLGGGVTTFELEVDTVDGVVSFSDVTFTVTLNTNITGGTCALNAGGAFCVDEQEDDELVTDITPSSITWNTVDGADSGANASIIPIGAQTAVIGSDDVFALEFEVEAQESSDVIIDEFQFLFTVDDQASAPLTTAQTPNSWMTEARLYVGGISPDNLIDIEGASDFSAFAGGGTDETTATFDDFEWTIPSNQDERFQVVIGLIDDDNLAGDTITAEVSLVDAEDEDNDDITVAAPVGNSGVITISGVGTLAVVGDQDEPEANEAQAILGNALSPYVASFELTAVNEGIMLEDVQLQAFETNESDFASSVETVFIYDEEGNLVDSEVVGGNVAGTTGQDVVNFDDINFTFPEGSENIFVKVQTRKIGKNAPGIQTDDMNFEMLVTEAEGASSGDTVTPPAVTGPGSTNPFNVVDVRISNVAFVDSFGGTSVANTLSDNVEQVLAILAITADSSTNTDSVDGSDLQLILDSVEIEKQGVAVNAVTITKINGTDSGGEAISTTNLAVGTVLDFFDMTNLGGEDEELDPGQTAYYKIEGFPQLTAAAGESVKIALRNLDSTTADEGIEYQSDDGGGSTLIQQLRLDFDELDTEDAISEEV